MPTANRLGSVIVVGSIYVIVGVASADLAQSATSSEMRQAWRLAAWILSLVVFVGHMLYERARPGNTTRSLALHVAAAVAIGGFGLAVVGPARAYWGTERFWRVTILSLVLWPLLLGLPAFLVALAAGSALERWTPRAKPGSP